MIELGVNIDHIATIRQARMTYEPAGLVCAMEASLPSRAEVLSLHEHDA